MTLEVCSDKRRRKRRKRRTRRAIATATATVIERIRNAQNLKKWPLLLDIQYYSRPLSLKELLSELTNRGMFILNQSWLTCFLELVFFCNICLNYVVFILILRESTSVVLATNKGMFILYRFLLICCFDHILLFAYLFLIVYCLFVLRFKLCLQKADLCNIHMLSLAMP